MKLVTSAQMRDLEAGARAAGVDMDTLMANAGLAVAQEAWMQLGQVAERRILVLVGPGNNGGDGLVAARHLAEWQGAVRCYALTPRDDPQWQATVEAGLSCTDAASDSGFATLEAWLDDAELVIDALLGTGHARPIAGDLAEILSRLAQTRARPSGPKLVAVDLPTGLDADSGRVDPLAVEPDETVTFQVAKLGLYTQPGAAVAGSLEVVDIGIPPELGLDLPIELLERRQAKTLLPSRPADANKGTFGRVLVVAGSRQYPGAAILAASAAYRVGAGLVTLATPASLICGVVAAMPEVTYLPLPEPAGGGVPDVESLFPITQALPDYDALVVGCGLGLDPVTQLFVRTLLRHTALRDLKGIVVDADGLNALAGTEWSSQIAAPFVVTPHPGEMARLAESDVAAVQSARVDVALARAAEWRGTVVLKGANTVVASRDGRARVSEVAHAGLATAGTGDVLSGAIGGLLAQGLPPFDAASLAVYLHGDAGVRAGATMGTAGMRAGDVLAQLPLAGRSLAGEDRPESSRFSFGPLSTGGTEVGHNPEDAG